MPAATAGAALPTGGGKVIVPGVSIGSVKLGMTPDEVTAIWGAPECFRGTCYWEETPSNRNFNTGTLSVKYLGGKAVEVAVNSPFKASFGTTKPSFTGPVLAYKTSKGIKIGSKKSAVKTAYPKATPRPRGQGFNVKGPGKAVMGFVLIRSAGLADITRIYRIVLATG